MRPLFEQIDVQATELGEISLRRRRIPALTDQDIYEVKLGEEFLMSSLFTAAEEALADLGLAAVAGDDLDVVVGGLGLGHTAVAALNCERVGRLRVVELLEAVIDWHRDELVPLGARLNADRRCEYVRGSFFELAETGFEPDRPEHPVDAILLDIDHTPSDWLNDANAAFYAPGPLGRMAGQLRGGGVFAMWSNDPPDAAFQARLGAVFKRVDAEIIRFYNPFQNREATATVYLAVR